MILDDLDAFCRACVPDEAESPLIVDPDTMLTPSFAAQGLKPVSRNCRHVLQLPGVIQHAQLPPCHGPDVGESAALLAVKEFFGFLAAEGSYHTVSIPRRPLNEAR